MRLNKKIITRIAVLSLPAVMPVSLVMIARLTMWAAGADWTTDAGGAAAVVSLTFGVISGAALIPILWPEP